MFKIFKKSKKIYIKIYDNDKILYQGPWNDIPLDEEVIIQNSIKFYDDPNPCHIHRTAVRVRLIAELEKALQGNLTDISTEWIEKLSHSTGYDITKVTFLEK